MKRTRLVSSPKKAKRSKKATKSNKATITGKAKVERSPFTIYGAEAAKMREAGLPQCRGNDVVKPTADRPANVKKGAIVEGKYGYQKAKVEVNAHATVVKFKPNAKGRFYEGKDQTVYPVMIKKGANGKPVTYAMMKVKGKTQSVEFPMERSGHQINPLIKLCRP